MDFPLSKVQSPLAQQICFTNHKEVILWLTIIPWNNLTDGTDRLIKPDLNTTSMYREGCLDQDQHSRQLL